MNVKTNTLFKQAYIVICSLLFLYIGHIEIRNLENAADIKNSIRPFTTIFSMVLVILGLLAKEYINYRDREIENLYQKFYNRDLNNASDEDKLFNKWKSKELIEIENKRYKWNNGCSIVIWSSIFILLLVYIFLGLCYILI